VAVAAVAGDAQQVAGQLEVRVASAGRLETAVARGERGVQVVTVRLAEILVGAPAAGGEALRGNHRETVARGIQMHAAAGGYVGLRRGVERIGITVGVVVRQ